MSHSISEMDSDLPEEDFLQQLSSDLKVCNHNFNILVYYLQTNDCSVINIGDVRTDNTQ